MIALYNIRDGRNGGLQSATRALGKKEVDIVISREVNITDPQYAIKSWNGYETWTATAGSQDCGRVVLMMRENERYNFPVENEKMVDPNVVSCKKVCGRGKKRWFIVGCYLSFSDTTDVT